jgi:hypothetical protein
MIPWFNSSPLLPTLAEKSAGVAVRLVGDHLDHAWFVRDGHRTIVTAYMADKSLGSTNNYKRVEGASTYATSWGAHTFNGNIRGGTDLNSGMPAYETFALGDGQPNDNTKFSASAYLAADTFLCPAFVGLGAAPGGRWSIYLLLGAP